MVMGSLSVSNKKQNSSNKQKVTDSFKMKTQAGMLEILEAELILVSFRLKIF